jgi:hypothetical protein
MWRRWWRQVVVFLPLLAAGMAIPLLRPTGLPLWLQIVLLAPLCIAAVIASALLQARAEHMSVNFTTEPHNSAGALSRQLASLRQTVASADFWAGRFLLPVAIALLIVTPINQLISRWLQQAQEQAHERQEDTRERERRRHALLQSHLERLRPVLRADADALKEVAQRTEMTGAPLLSQAHNPGSSRNEMEARFAPDPLSSDVKNHYPTFADNKARLRRDVEDQDDEYAGLVSRVVKQIALPPAHPYRDNVARAFVWKCLGLGPGMTLTTDDKSHSYSWLGGSGNGGGPAPPQLVEAFQAFTSFRPDSKVEGHCASLRTRGAKIVDDAEKLSAEARMLAEETTLSGDCKYTRLD